MKLGKLLRNYKILLLIVLLLVSSYLVFLKDLNPSTVDLNLGIEFAGGVRIPISLEKSVDAETMALIVDTIKQRINKFGLTQAQVRPIGNKEILVEIPQAQPEVIRTIENIIREHGRFEALIDGKVALNSTHIIPSSIGGAQGEQIGKDGSWQLVFSITGAGEKHFASTASGKTGQNVLMFLDRPENAAVLVPKSIVAAGPGISEVLHKEGDDILFVNVEDFNQSGLLKTKPSTIIIPDTLKKTNKGAYDALLKAGYSNNISSQYRLREKSEEDMTPEQYGQLGFSSVFSWRAIGLRSAPVLQVEPVNREQITQYSITGSARGDTQKEQVDSAILEVKALKSVLTGEKLPVAASVGSYYNIAPSLGKQFLTYSIYGILAAILLVGLVVMLYYRKIELVLPVIFTNIVEIFVTLALLGALGTLDLAAMAGVIALIGSSVDNQIVITDELLKKRGEEISPKRKLKDAFYIVFTTAGLAILSMMPLWLSDIVEIRGFATSAILSVIIGILVTRPAYGAIVEEMFFKDNE